MTSLAVLSIALWLVPAAPAAEAPASMTTYRCYICHSDHEARAGPAFSDVARVYRQEPDAVRRIAAAIRAGASSGGPWHMPPHPEVSASEARAMARYILTVNAPSAPREVKQETRRK